MDEKKIADVQQIEDENLEGAAGGARATNSVKIICELNAGNEGKSEDEGEDTMLPNPFVCPFCRKSYQICTCYR